MQVSEDGGCFVCGRDNPIGLRAAFAVDRQAQRAAATLVIPPGFQGWAGVVHGGIIAALLDEACIHACRSLGEQFVTAELAVRYRQPVPVGQELTVTGEVTERKRKILQVRARLEIDGRLHAEADSRVFFLG